MHRLESVWNDMPPHDDSDRTNIAANKRWNVFSKWEHTLHVGNKISEK